MKLLHGSNTVIVHPDINKCQSKNDFGKGFYMTTSWNRAWEMQFSILSCSHIGINMANNILRMTL